MPRGRPVFEPTDKQRGQVEAMLRDGISQDETAKALGITEKTLAKHFRVEIETGSTKANAQVGEFRSALAIIRTNFSCSIVTRYKC